MLRRHSEVPAQLIDAAIEADRRLKAVQEAEALEEEKRWMDECHITVAPRITQFIDDVFIRIPITYVDRMKFKKPEDVIELVVERATKYIRSTNPKL